MIEQVVQRWHRFRAADTTRELDTLLADDVVFHSPIVYTPQHGKDVAARYIAAAKRTFSGGRGDDAFRYTKQVLDGDVAMLEFETTIGDTYVDGVDVIRCDGAGRIVELRVMVRPLQAVHTVHEQMRTLVAGRLDPA